jgi:chemotaxis protein CheX
MNQRTIDDFGAGLKNYFEQAGKNDAVYKAPIVYGNDDFRSNSILDITGVIGMTGGYKGCAYFTCNREFLREFWQETFSAEELTDDMLADLTGETANMISGICQQSAPKPFEISTPAVIFGKNASVNIKTPVVSFPVSWRSHLVYYVVGVNP